MDLYHPEHRNLLSSSTNMNRQCHNSYGLFVQLCCCTICAHNTITAASETHQYLLHMHISNRLLCIFDFFIKWLTETFVDLLRIHFHPSFGCVWTICAYDQWLDDITKWQNNLLANNCLFCIIKQS